jgi:hypothetical protein
MRLGVGSHSVRVRGTYLAHRSERCAVQPERRPHAGLGRHVQPPGRGIPRHDVRRIAHRRAPEDAHRAKIDRHQPQKLSQLGWGPRRDANALDVPGETRDIKIVTEGVTWLVLAWNPPIAGGRVAAYNSQRRTRDGSSWDPPTLGPAALVTDAAATPSPGSPSTPAVHAVSCASRGAQGPGTASPRRRARRAASWLRRAALCG